GAVFGYLEHQRYFFEEIKPRLDPKRRFIGPVDTRRKARLLSGARCVLIPSVVPETSSLAAMEALSYGTPVIAFDTRALCEVVDHGRTGYLVRDADEMAKAIREIGRIDRETCRR